jgi:hypothetical protein
MSLFGKILAFLNVLGVFGVLALGLMTYSKKLQWQNAVEIQRMMLQGLALDNKQLDEESSGLAVDNQSDANIKQVVPGPFVKTQVEEVERVHNIVKSKIGAAPDAPSQLNELALALGPFAVDLDQYVKVKLIQRWMQDAQSIQDLKTQLSAAATAAAGRNKEERTERSDEEAFREFVNLLGGGPKTPFVNAYIKAMKEKPGQPFDANFDAAIASLLADLTADLDALYAAAHNGTVVGTPATNAGPGVQRYLIVRYLFNAAPYADPPGMNKAAESDFAPPAIRRVISVVGLEAFPSALADQAARLGTLNEQLRTESTLPNTVSAEIVKAIERERSEFAALHNKMIDALREQASKLADRQARVTRATAAAVEQERLAAVSKAINEKLDKALAENRADTAAYLKTIRELTAEFHKVQVKTRDASEVLQQLESQIRRLERLAP